MKRIGAILLLIFLVIPLGSSAISITQPNEIYNFGDLLDLEIIVKPSIQTTSNFIASLVCEQNFVELHRSLISLNANEEKLISLKFFLLKSFTNSIKGKCSIVTSYGSETQQTPQFEISDNIDSNILIKGEKFNPRDTIEISGEAYKFSGSPVEGFVELSISELNIEVLKFVKEGKFEFSFVLPENSVPGKYFASLKIYERDSSGEITNQVERFQEITVNSIPRKIEIVTSPENNDEVHYSVFVYDQADNLLKGELQLSIYEPGDFLFEKKSISSGEKSFLQLNQKTPPGYWKIEAQTGEIKSTKLFQVQEKMDALFTLSGNTLIVTNIGNVRYTKPLEIGIGLSKEIKNLDLGIGESLRLKLSAPDGEYSIQVNDGNKELNLGTAPLTGRAIGVSEYLDSQSFSGFSKYLIGLILLIILALIVLFLKKRKKTLIPNPGKITSPVKSNTHSAILVNNSISGRREDAVSLVLNIKSDPNTKYSNQALESALIVAKTAGAKIYIEENFRIILLSKVINKTEKNETSSLKIAIKIKEILEEYNKKFKEKIDFGIAITKGEIISEVVEGKFKFTSTDTFIIKSKNLSNNKGEIIISDKIYRPFMGVIKAEKINEEAFKLISFNDREEKKA